MSASLNQPSIKPLTLQDVIKKHPQYFFEAMLEFLGDARNPDMHRYRDILQSLVDGVVKRMKKNMSEQEKTMKAIKKIGSVIAIYKKKYQ